MMFTQSTVKLKQKTDSAKQYQISSDNAYQILQYLILRMIYLLFWQFQYYYFTYSIEYFNIKRYLQKTK